MTTENEKIESPTILLPLKEYNKLLMERESAKAKASIGGMIALMELKKLTQLKAFLDEKGLTGEFDAWAAKQKTKEDDAPTTEKCQTCPAKDICQGFLCEKDEQGPQGQQGQPGPAGTGETKQGEEE